MARSSEVNPSAWADGTTMGSAGSAPRKLSFPVWHDRDSLVGKQYSVPGVPASYLIGRDGRIAYKVLGEYDWLSPEARAAVEQLITTGGTADEHR